MTLPITLRKKYGLKTGDVVTLIETAQGFVVIPKQSKTVRNSFFAMNDELSSAFSDLNSNELEALVNEAVKAVRAKKTFSQA